MTTRYCILKNAQEVLPHLDSIKGATDSNRLAFGFNPLGAYEDAAYRGKLWIAADETGNYLGHLMHGGKWPELRIFQIHVSEKSRGLGVASTLIKEIASYGEEQNCLNLRADVANDLTDAVKFWQSQGFCALQPRRKKNLSGREVLIFYKRLSTPSLLPNDPLPLSITSQAVANDADSYVIDLNIFLALLKKEADEKMVAEIIQAALAGEFSLFVTPEFQVELARTKKDKDPIFELAEKTLPAFEKMDEKELKRLQGEIKLIVFPGRSELRKDAGHDESDIRHLAYCIQNSKSGFITEEKAIIRAKDELYEKYRLTIYSLQDFRIEHFGNIDSSYISVPLSSNGQAINITNIKNAAEIRTFLDNLGDDTNEVAKVILKSSTRGIRERKVIFIGENISAVYMAHTKGAKHNVLEGAFITSENLSFNREVVFQHMLECFMRLSQGVKANRITFHLRRADFDLEKICMTRGFERTTPSLAGMIALTKIACPPLITKANWKTFRETFSQDTGIDLPLSIPAIKSAPCNPLTINAAKNGRAYEAELFELESFLSPSLIMLPGRQGIIISILPIFATTLLDRADNLLPFPMDEEALLRLEKAYFRKPTKASLFTVGMPIVFYESGSGRGAIGCARITSTKVMTCENALKIRRYGVLHPPELEKYADNQGNIHAITFDNFKVFPQPVTMRKLQEYGCARANLVGPEKISDKQLSDILHEGMGATTRDVLISIQPAYVAKILNGKKTIELRKKPFPVKDGMRIWIYSTSPVSSIEATAFVINVDSDTPENIWKKYGSKACISKSDFDTYFADSSEAYALHINNARRLSKKLKLEEIKQLSNGFTPPQYYRYVDHNSVLFETLIER